MNSLQQDPDLGLVLAGIINKIGDGLGVEKLRS